MHDPRLTRLDGTRLRIENPYGIEATLFAAEEVPVETAAVDELLRMLELQRTVEAFAATSPECFESPPVIERLAVTPDFHKARGIPVGTVMSTSGFLVPQAIGNDINCGMRLHLTSLDGDAVSGNLDELETAFRHIFFEGGRNLPMSRMQREALLKRGLEGLFDAVPRSHDAGLWGLVHELELARDLDRIERRGSLPAENVVNLDDYLGPADRFTRDSQLGSIGGGNHFVEIQRVEKIFDAVTAYAWGLRPGMVTVMVHTGSLSIGHVCGSHFRDVVRSIYPKSIRFPENGIFPLPEGDRYRTQSEKFWDSLHNAANFAFANRMFLALMALSGMRRVLGDVSCSLLYDAPHNFLWREEIDGKSVVLHRKGACPARGYYGEPVLVPGSMGASSFILAGQGNREALFSASHGAGRALSRGAAIHGYDTEFEDFLKRFRVVTPVDFRRVEVKSRRDIVEQKLAELKQEAPFAYKGIGPVIETLVGAKMARPVVELTPLMTVKG